MESKTEKEFIKELLEQSVPELKCRNWNKTTMNFLFDIVEPVEKEIMQIMSWSNKKGWNMIRVASKGIVEFATEYKA